MKENQSLLDMILYANSLGIEVQFWTFNKVLNIRLVYGYPDKRPHALQFSYDIPYLKIDYPGAEKDQYIARVLDQRIYEMIRDLMEKGVMPNGPDTNPTHAQTRHQRGHPSGQPPG